MFEPPETFNIADYFLDARLREGRGERTALHLDDCSLTYREVHAAAARFGAVLRRLEVRQEERVMIALPDGADFVAALFGTLKLGAVVVMVNPQLKEDEIAALLAYSRARVAVVHKRFMDTWSAAAAGAFPQSLLVVGDDITEAHGRRSFVFEVLRAGEGIETVETHRDDPAIWLFSGGTTGRPKAVVQSHRSFANTTELYAKGAVGYREDDVTLSVPKLYFGYATGSNLFFPFAVGASAALFPEHPSPEVIFDKIRRFKPTILINVPTLLQRMVAHPEAKSQDLSRLRFVTSAGEALPPALYERFKELFGVEILDGLGTAEMWHIFVTNRPGDVRPGTLGRVVDGFELAVRDDEGADLPDGEVGRLWVRGDSRAHGYWQNQPKSQEAFRGEWFVGGDLVSRDADGYVTYCGRADDVLKVGGKWFVPKELEGCLLQHPEVKECAVIGAQDEQGLTKPYAFVLAAGGKTDLEEELKSFALERLQAYKHPRRVIVLDEFPRTHLGKVDRGRLRSLI